MYGDGNRETYALKNLECIFESGRKVCYILAFYRFDSVFHFLGVVGSGANLIESGMKREKERREGARNDVNQIPFKLRRKTRTTTNVDYLCKSYHFVFEAWHNRPGFVGERNQIDKVVIAQRVQDCVHSYDGQFERFARHRARRIQQNHLRPEKRTFNHHNLSSSGAPRPSD